MSYADFCRIAKTARAERTESTVLTLIQAYADMDCAVYPVDAKLFVETFGGPPPGWAWDSYSFGQGGITGLRRV